MSEEVKVDLKFVKNAVNFYDLAKDLGEEKIIVSYNLVKISCPFHKEKTPSFVFNQERGSFRCFGCHKSGDIFDYTQQKLGLKSFKEALDYILAYTGINKDSLSRDRITVPQYRKQLKAMTAMDPKSLKEFTVFNEGDIKAMVGDRKTMFEERGFTKETLDYFEVGFDSNDKRVVVPIRDQESNLVGVTGRTIYKNFKELGIAKWKHYKGSNISDNFFNIQNAIVESRLNNGSIIICEGPSDVMWLTQHGYKNSIACLNNRITKVQKGILLKNFMNIYLMLDADTGGDTGKSFILDEIRGYFNIFDVKIEEGKDPDQLSKEELIEAFKNARKV